MENLNSFANSVMIKFVSFFKQNLTIILISLAAGIYVNGFAVTNPILSIDQELFFTSGHLGIEWLQLGRWGIYFLSRIIPMNSFPFISQITGIIFMALAALLIVNKYDKIPQGAKIIFCVLVTTSPIFAHMEYFSVQISYFAIGVFIAVASYEMFIKGIEDKNKRWLLFPSIFCLTFATGVYQSHVLLFLMPLAIDNFVKFINNETTFTKIVKTTAYALIFILIAIGFHYLILKMLAFQSSGYTDTFLYWTRVDILQNIGKEMMQVYRILMGQLQYPVLLQFATFALLLSIPHIFHINKNKTFKNLLIIIFLVLLFIGSAVSLRLAMGGYMPTRVLVNLTFFMAGALFIYYIVSSKIEKLLIGVFVIFSVFYNGSHVTQLFFSSYLTLEADKVVAERVLEKIYDVEPNFYYGKTPVAFIGFHYYGTRNQAIIHNEVFGGSFWTWDNGNPARMINFMKVMSGLPMEARLANAEEFKAAKEYSKNMPIWPSKDSVQLHNGVVIVKFALHLPD